MDKIHRVLLLYVQLVELQGHFVLWLARLGVSNSGGQGSSTPKLRVRHVIWMWALRTRNLISKGLGMFGKTGSIHHGGKMTSFIIWLLIALFVRLPAGWVCSMFDNPLKQINCTVDRTDVVALR